jgi:adenosine/AMP kinase
MNLESVKLKFPEGANIILGQSHFVKTVEDLYEAMMNSVPNPKFGIAFSEASGARLVRHIGTDAELEKLAAKNLMNVGAGHCFLIIMENVFPINVLNAIKAVPEVCNIFCATANVVEVVVARRNDAGAILGVFDGNSPLGIEDDDGIAWRMDILRRFGYKAGS